MKHVWVMVSCKMRKEIEMPSIDNPCAVSVSYLWTSVQTLPTFNKDITTCHNLVSSTKVENKDKQCTPRSEITLITAAFSRDKKKQLLLVSHQEAHCEHAFR